MVEPTVMLFDLSVALIMYVLAYLSKRLGDAMKTPPWYLMLYGAIVLVFISCGLEIAATVLSLQVPQLITLATRLVAGILAFCVCLRYWNWLFSEFFGV
ncbi:MAG: hypothetical protein JW768_14115 [Chitinispirillaceae bacterium]|nr:hypothetical protein [Chitinispirillaceae bacterium]